MQPAGLPGRKPAMGPPQPHNPHPAAAWPFPAASIIGARSPASRTPAAPARPAGLKPGPW